MTRHTHNPSTSLHALRNALRGAIALIFTGSLAAVALSSPASAATPSPSSAGWCVAYGSNVVGWTDTHPNIPICGPGPAYGGRWYMVTLPGPGGTMGGYFNGTPGFQCVELAERYLAVKYGFAPTNAEGDQVAQNYHALYPRTTLTVNGTSGAVGHAPVAGDVISFSSTPSFNGWNDGHVAVVNRATVDPHTGNGVVVVAQQNVGSGYYHYAIDLVGWRLVDPKDSSTAEFQFPYAEWLHVNQLPTTHGTSALMKNDLPKANVFAKQLKTALTT